MVVDLDVDKVFICSDPVDGKCQTTNSYECGDQAELPGLEITLDTIELNDDRGKPKQQKKRSSPAGHGHDSARTADVLCGPCRARKLRGSCPGCRPVGPQSELPVADRVARLVEQAVQEAGAQLCAIAFRSLLSTSCVGGVPLWVWSR
ncbi:hypothetical protein OG389_05570 [Streptomyces sp. NBC_00435]|uniref:hypothetical protein n=1 Tax=Streptomyces sp. NBC_00435 TaxID=2903649 RepID=UPI002E1AADA0